MQSRDIVDDLLSQVKLPPAVQEDFATDPHLAAKLSESPHLTEVAWNLLWSVRTLGSARELVSRSLSDAQVTTAVTSETRSQVLLDLAEHNPLPDEAFVLPKFPLGSARLAEYVLDHVSDLNVLVPLQARLAPESRLELVSRMSSQQLCDDDVVALLLCLDEWCPEKVSNRKARRRAVKLLLASRPQLVERLALLDAAEPLPEAVFAALVTSERLRDPLAQHCLAESPRLNKFAALSFIANPRAVPSTLLRIRVSLSNVMDVRRALDLRESRHPRSITGDFSGVAGPDLDWLISWSNPGTGWEGRAPRPARLDGLLALSGNPHMSSAAAYRTGNELLAFHSSITAPWGMRHPPAHTALDPIIEAALDSLRALYDVRQASWSTLYPLVDVQQGGLPEMDVEPADPGLVARSAINYHASRAAVYLAATLGDSPERWRTFLPVLRSAPSQATIGELVDTTLRLCD